MRDPRINPKAGDRIARVMRNRNGVTGVFTRIVLETCGDLIIYCRKRPERPCKCHLIDWREWSREAKVHTAANTKTP